MNTDPELVSAPDPDELLVEKLAATVARWSLITGVLLVTIGVAALFLPGVTAMAISFWMGLLFLAVGIGFVVHAVQTRNHNLLAFDLTCGMLYLFGALVLLVFPRSGIMTLALILGLVFISEGLGRIVFALRAKFGHPPLWWLIDGAVAIVLGAIVLWNWPADSAWVVGILFGLRMIFAGIAVLMFSRMIKKGTTPRIEEQPDVSDSTGEL
jgi:uncharacterized membrane protein HdeD (DUF308 family)